MTEKGSIIKGIGHVGILVNNLDEAVNLYCALLGLDRPYEFKEWPGEGMRHAMLKVGNQSFELMEPYPGSALSKFMEKNGEGMHHVNIVVSDLEKVANAVKANGGTIIRRGTNVCFLHPKSTKGVLIEVLQRD